MLKQLMLMAGVLFVAASAGADTFRCNIVVAVPTKETPSCGSQTSCQGIAWQWSNRAECEITCFIEGPSPGELVENGTATCTVTATGGEPDCGGIECR